MSTNKTYILCPGQGAQAVGMGKDFYEQSPKAHEIFDRANQILGWDLSSICFTGPEERTNQTDVSQPAIYTTSVACCAAAGLDPAIRFGVSRLEPWRVYRAPSWRRFYF